VDKPETAYHWVLSLNGSVRGREATVGWTGVVAITPGQTRSQVYDQLKRWLLEEIQRQTGSPMENPATIFFSIEPEQIL
jgi:hypothetical protein